MRRRDPETVWHVCGTRMVRELIRPVLHSRCWRCDLGLPAKLRDEGPKL